MSPKSENRKSETGFQFKKKSFLIQNGRQPSVWVHILIIGVTLAAIGVTIFFSKKNYSETIQLATEQFNQQQLILARSAAVAIEHFIVDLEDDLLTLSRFPSVQKMESRILERMKNLYLGVPPQTSSRRLDKNGILRFIYPNEGWREDLINQDYSQKDYFQKAKETGEVVISGLIINEVGERRIRVVRPVYVEDKKGTRAFNGVIIASFDPKTLSELYISPIVSGETGYAWLLNEDGVLLAHHEKGFVGQDGFKVRVETNPDLSYDAINNIQRKMMAGEEGVSRYVSGWHRGQRGKIEKLIAYTPVHVFDKIWSVAVCAPVDEVERITSKAYRNQLYSLGFIILILTAGGVFSFITLYRWSRSLQQEIEIRKRAEEHITYLNRVLGSIREVNQLAIRERDQDKLLHSACEILTKVREYRMVWVGLIESGHKRVIPVASSGFVEGYLDSIKITWDDSKTGKGPTGTAIKTRKPSVIRDIAHNPKFEPWRQDALKLGYRSSIALPMIHEDSVYGALNVYSNQKDAFDQEEVGLLVEIAGDLTFALFASELEKERKRAEEALKESQRYTRGLIESNLDAMVAISSEGKITDVNYAMELITGMSRKELIGTDCSNYFTDPDATKRAFQQALRDNYVRDYPLEIKHRDGKVTPVLCNASIYKDTKGDIAGVITVARDISELKKLESQLRQAQKMEAIGLLAGGIAHDFNNILTAIQGYTDLALTEIQEDNPLYQDIKEIQKASMRASNLTRQLLLFSRRQPMEYIPLDLNKVINELIKMLNRLIGENISLTTDLASNLWTVKGDAGTTEQVIMNLVVNARDAMPKEGEITIKTENLYIDEEYCKDCRDARPGEFVCLLVRDTGVGIDQSIIDRIFEPFFTTKEVGKATGMGLSVVYGIVKQHEGWVNVESSPGKGSIFRICLPAVSGEPEEKQKEGVSLEEVKGKGERILLVEDEESVRALTKRVLSKNGYVVFTATNVQEALDIFKKEKGNFDLIFSDIILPDGRGPELLEEILKLKPKISVLFTSGYSDEKLDWSTIREGDYPYLQKPYSLSALLRVVRDALKVKGA